MLNFRRTAVTLGLLLSGVLPVQAEAPYARASVTRVAGAPVEDAGETTVATGKSSGRAFSQTIIPAYTFSCGPMNSRRLNGSQ